MKAKVGELEGEVIKVFSRRTRKELNGAFPGVSEKRKLLVSFHDGCNKDTKLNQLTIVTVERSPANEEAEVPTVAVIPDDSIDLEKGY